MGDVAETPPTDLSWPFTAHPVDESDLAGGEAENMGDSVEQESAATLVSVRAPIATLGGWPNLPVISAKTAERMPNTLQETVPVAASAGSIAELNSSMGPTPSPRIAPLNPTVIRSRSDLLRAMPPPMSLQTDETRSTVSKWSPPPQIVGAGSPVGNSSNPVVHDSANPHRRRVPSVATADQLPAVVQSLAAEGSALEGMSRSLESILDRRLASQQTAFDQLRERVEEHERLWLEQNALRRIAAPRF